MKKATKPKKYLGATISVALATKFRKMIKKQKKLGKYSMGTALETAIELYLKHGIE